MPPKAATKGNKALDQWLNSPTTTSRLISKPTSKKKIAIKPSLIQYCTGSAMLNAPTPKVICTLTKQSFFKRFSQVESLSGGLLFFAAIAAMIISNTPLQAWYHNFFVNVHITFGVGALSIAEPVQYWINDGLMAIFFLLVGLEIKREVVYY